MSTVQLAFDTRLERYVAIKLLAEHLADDTSFVARFRREALAAARLVHPNVVQVFDFGLDDETARHFIVMEYVDGPLVRGDPAATHGALDPRDAVDSSTQACSGLDYAHRNGVIHRDVKPGNLLRSDEGVVKLADFGIAKAAEDSEITQAGSVLGTAAYLSPEQARGEKAGPPADLYALGVVSYQLLSGRLPYEAASLTELARQQETRPAARAARRRARRCRPRWREAVLRALDPLPESRYEGALEMGEALLDGLRGIAPTRPTPPRRSTRPRRRGCSTSDGRHRAAPRTSSRPAQRTAPPARADRRAPAAPRARAAGVPPPAPRGASRASAAPLRGLVVLVLAARASR